MEDKELRTYANDSHCPQKIEDTRSEIIFQYYQWWKTEHPEKKIFNKALGDYIHVNHDSLTDAIRYAKLSYRSTTAVLYLNEILANATLVSEVKTAPATKSQHPYEKMLMS